MIKADIFRKNNNIYRFTVKGHADFAEEGSDIVCSAVSILVVNTINAVETFTDEAVKAEADGKNGGFIDYRLTDIEKGGKSHDAQLLLETMVLGLKTIENEYYRYIKVNDKGGRMR
jgi:uncharacterized protein YsxB (DUF464 family)